MFKWLGSLFGQPSSGEGRHDLDQYLYYRKLGRNRNLELIRELPKPALPECGKKLGLYKAGTLIINQDDEIAILYDYCLHHYRRAGKNGIERAMETRLSADTPDETTYMNALLGARFSVFQINEIIPHLGAKLRDILADIEITIHDLGLSSTATEGSIIAGRLLAFDNFNMSSGTLIPIPENVFEEKIRPVINKFASEDKNISLLTSLSSAQMASLEAQIIRIALHAAGEDISFFTDMES